MNSTIRSEMLRRRSALSQEERRSASEAICEKLLRLPEIRWAGVVMLYSAFRGEVQTEKLARELRRLGKRIAYPRSIKADYTLQVCEVDSPEQLVSGAYGIKEPAADAHLLAPCEIDVVIVPGAAYDERFDRIGYGAGYYDRFLPQLRADARSIAPAYDFQLVEGIEPSEHDVPMDIIVTPKRTLIRGVSRT